jgi:hypothetical protein
VCAGSSADVCPLVPDGGALWTPRQRLLAPGSERSCTTEVRALMRLCVCVCVCVCLFVCLWGISLPLMTDDDFWHLDQNFHTR